MAFASGPGTARGGWSHPPVLTRNLMDDRREGLSLTAGLAQGVGKAHRQVNYAHFEFRNYDRSAQAKTGRVT